MKHNQTFFHGTYSNLTYFFLIACGEMEPGFCLSNIALMSSKSEVDLTKISFSKEIAEKSFVFATFPHSFTQCFIRFS